MVLSINLGPIHALRHICHIHAYKHEKWKKIKKFLATLQEFRIHSSERNRESSRIDFSLESILLHQQPRLVVGFSFVHLVF